MNFIGTFLPLAQTGNSFAPRILDHLWLSSISAGFVSVLSLSLREYQARIRYNLLLVASATFLLPFTLLLDVGTSLSRSSRTEAGINPVIHLAAQPFTETAIRNTQHAAASVSASGFEPHLAIWPLALAALWSCGLACVYGFWWLEWRKIYALIRRSTLLCKGREIENLRRLELTHNHRSALRLALVPDLIEPGVVGFLRPTLLWPQGISECLSDAQLEAVPTHELCHVRHRDNLTTLVQMLVSGLFWFHPLVWWLGRTQVEERERACDEEVLLQSKAKVYAESLLKVCEFCVDPSPMCWTGLTGADLKSRVGYIMSHRAKGTLGKTLRAVLVATGTGIVATPMVFGLMTGKMPIYGQILHAKGPLPSYEVATIKPLQPGQGPPPISHRPGVLTHVGSTKQLISYAYNLPTLSVAQIVNAPEWSAKEQYVVQRQVDETTFAAMQKMGEARSQQLNQLMLQSSLADRFKLKVHLETRELPMYALVVDKGGSKLHPSSEAPDPTESVLPPPMAPGAAPSLTGVRKGFFAIPKGGTFEMQAKALTLDELAQMLQRQPDAGGRLIVNQTDLRGYYDCSMKWAADAVTSVIDEHGNPSNSDEPSFFTAIREQLGLRLVPTKGPAEVIVIDHIEKPSEN